MTDAIRVQKRNVFATRTRLTRPCFRSAEKATTFVYGQYEGKALACMFARNR